MIVLYPFTVAQVVGRKPGEENTFGTPKHSQHRKHNPDVWKQWVVVHFPLKSKCGQYIVELEI